MFKKILLTVFAMSLAIISPVFLSAQSSPEQFQSPAVKDNLPVFYQQLKDQLTFPLSYSSQKPKDFNAWKKTARAKVMELLCQPSDKSAFNPKIIDEQDRGTYFARKVVFNVTDQSRVVALMLVPKGKGPFPAALLLHDHGSKFDIGKEKLIEPWGDEEKIKSAKGWSAKYFTNQFVGNELVARGYAVLAVDALGWGDRSGMNYESQQALASNFFNMGSSLAGLMAREDIRSAEFLASFPEVDKSKIAAVGFSMGAYRAWQVAALSDNISACIAVCWMTTIKGIMVPGNNTLRGQSAFWQLHPGLFNYLDFPDVASLAAPKPILFYNGDQDKLFPVDAVKESYEKMRQVWKSQNAEDKFQSKIWPLNHVFFKEEQDEAFAWLDKQFKK
jgi:dienelactone hydrolase